ncbi:cysteine desulfurase [Candidatus Woesearchaeota archaeon]|nr:cysteine desulfurase [Candidatus Woesearchaeota archaeon]
MGYDVEKVRQDFPLLAGSKPPIYFDNACITLRPRQVIDKVNEYYEEYPACAGRSVHRLSRRVDEEVYKARRLVQRFIHAKKEEEVIFQRNATEAINLVARSFPFRKGDVILVSDKEHNSNLLPWQVVAEKKGLALDVIHSNDDNTFSLDTLKDQLARYGSRVAMVAVGHTANLDGVTVPARDIIKHAHRVGAKVLLDAAQSIPHQAVNARTLDADYLAFSGHKMLGPSGIGVLYGQEKSLQALDVNNVGGETVQDATYERATWEGLPHRFEAGLQHYAGILGLGTAVEYLQRAGLKHVYHHEQLLNQSLHDGLRELPGVSFIGPEDARLRGGITSFNIGGLSGHDVASMLSASKDIMIRSGAHCVHAWFNKHGINGSARASLYLYNTEEEVSSFVEEVKGVARLGKRRRKR